MEELDGSSKLDEHSHEIQEFFEDAVLVGHRVTFLLSLLEKKLNVHFQQTLWDTLELARIFFLTALNFRMDSASAYAMGILHTS